MDEGCGVLTNSVMTTFSRRVAFELLGLAPLILLNMGGMNLKSSGNTV
jgi:hypothetical protein